MDERQVTALLMWIVLCTIFAFCIAYLIWERFWKKEDEP